MRAQDQLRFLRLTFFRVTFLIAAFVVGNGIVLAQQPESGPQYTCGNQGFVLDYDATTRSWSIRQTGENLGPSFLFVYTSNANLLKPTPFAVIVEYRSGRAGTQTLLWMNGYKRFVRLLRDNFRLTAHLTPPLNTSFYQIFDTVDTLSGEYEFCPSIQGVDVSARDEPRIPSHPMNATFLSLSNSRMDFGRVYGSGESWSRLFISTDSFGPPSVTPDPTFRSSGFTARPVQLVSPSTVWTPTNTYETLLLFRPPHTGRFTSRLTVTAESFSQTVDVVGEGSNLRYTLSSGTEIYPGTAVSLGPVAWCDRAEVPLRITNATPFPAEVFVSFQPEPGLVSSFGTRQDWTPTNRLRLAPAATQTLHLLFSPLECLSIGPETVDLLIHASTSFGSTVDRFVLEGETSLIPLSPVPAYEIFYPIP